jgi:hypothetical protein
MGGQLPRSGDAWNDRQVDETMFESAAGQSRGAQG